MNLVTFKSINVERLEFIKSVSLRLFCIKAQGSLILAAYVLFSFSEGPTFASHMGETVSAGIVPVLLPVSAWWLLLETRWSTSADSLFSDEARHCDPFSCILCSFMAFTGLPAVSAEGSPIPILFFNNWPFWPVIFCDNCLWEDDFSISFIRHTKYLGISYVAQGILKRLGSWWRELEEALSIHALPRSVSKSFHFALATPVDKRPTELYILPELEKGAQSPLFFNPQTHLGTSISHSDLDPEVTTLTSIRTPLIFFSLFLCWLLLPSVQKGFLLLSLWYKICPWVIINSYRFYSLKREYSEFTRLLDVCWAGGEEWRWEQGMGLTKKKKSFFFQS